MTHKSLSVRSCVSYIIISTNSASSSFVASSTLIPYLYILAIAAHSSSVGAIVVGVVGMRVVEGKGIKVRVWLRLRVKVKVKGKVKVKVEVKVKVKVKVEVKVEVRGYIYISTAVGPVEWFLARLLFS